MTTVTFDTPIKLPKQHFHNLEEFLPILMQYNFESDLIEEFNKAKQLKKEQWTNV